MAEVRLTAVQSFIQASDYLSPDSFVHAVNAPLAAAFRKVPAGEHLIVFPENIGTFLPLLGQPALLTRLPLTDLAIAGMLLRQLPQTLRKLFPFPRSALHLVMRVVGEHIWPLYYRTFSELAQHYNAWVVAGSLLYYEPAATPDISFEPRDENLYNISFTFAPDGTVASWTKKVNLVPELEDTLGLSTGTPGELTHVDAAFGRFGTLICYDGFCTPHSRSEPQFCETGSVLDQQKVRIIAQPAANPWPWDEDWIYNDTSKQYLRREQWLKEGLAATMEPLQHVQYGVNPHLIGTVMDNHFDGRSYIFRRSDAGVEIVAQAKASRNHPDSAEAVSCVVEL